MTKTQFKVFGINCEYIIIGMAVLVVALLVLNVVLLCKQAKMNKRYKSFMLGKSGESLEENVIRALSELEKLKVKSDAHAKDIDAIFKELETTYQKVGLVKYDAFNEMGGKLSFALTMLDKENNGFLLNSIQSREGCYTYIKEIVDGKSYLDLGGEEEKSLQKALSRE